MNERFLSHVNIFLQKCKNDLAWSYTREEMGALRKEVAQFKEGSMQAAR